MAHEPSVIEAQEEQDTCATGQHETNRGERGEGVCVCGRGEEGWLRLSDGACYSAAYLPGCVCVGS